jgi:hypothetical protein
MSLVAYAVYDVESGEVVHLHVEPADLGSSPEEIVHIADVQGTRRLHAVRLSADDLTFGAARVIDGALRADDGPNWGQAGVQGASVEPRLERQYRAQSPVRESG